MGGPALTSAKDDRALLIERVLSSHRIEASGRRLSTHIGITKSSAMNGGILKTLLRPPSTSGRFWSSAGIAIHLVFSHHFYSLFTVTQFPASWLDINGFEGQFYGGAVVVALNFCRSAGAD